MIKYEEAQINAISVHQIGNKAARDGIRLTQHETKITDTRLKEVMADYFFKSFKEPEFFFMQIENDEEEINPMYQLASNLFKNQDSTHQTSIEIAEHLYAKSDHPNIKSGDLMVSLVQDLIIEDQLVSALCILKSETKDAFLKLSYDADQSTIEFEKGISTTKIDKACLILNTNKSEGYKVCIIDKSNKEGEAQFWKNGFLKLVNRNDSYHKTKNVIQLTDQFVKEHLKESEGIEKSEEIQLMNSSADYFRHMESFEMDEYEKSVFKDSNVIDKFQDFKQDYQVDSDVHVAHKFDISKPAVKSSSKFFRSVMKLDKNFHVYIHGNRDMIERGTDSDGRKYYKLYYEEEN